MTFGIVAKRSVLLGIVLTACGRTPNLETRTFRLQSLDDHVAVAIIEPYVYGDRPNAPGAVAAMQGVLTVRETSDNLDKIARVLEEFDSPRQSVTLHFQVILANGAGSADPAIAEVEEELRKLFRFVGYRLVAQGSVTGLEQSHVNQKMFTENPDNQTFSRVMFGFYDVNANIGQVIAGGESGMVELHVELTGNSSVLFGSSVVLGIGNTIVLGTLQLPDNQALILTLRAELAG
jgi:hypothetical protein